MEIHREFMSRKVTLVFKSGRREELTKEETNEFDARMEEIQEQTRKGE